MDEILVDSRETEAASDGGSLLTLRADRASLAGGRRRKVAERFEQAAAVVPRDPRERRELDVLATLTVMSAYAAKSLNEVMKGPARYRGQGVTVGGVVTYSGPLAGRGLYRIKDGEAQLPLP
jgi:hypothetical protein